jgi:hypothetical protein
MRRHIGLVFLIATAATVSLSRAQPPVATPPAASGPSPQAVAPHGGPLRPPLFFAEEWKQTPKGGEHPVTAESIANANLELKLYVPSGQLMLTGSAGDENNPIHVWTGLCTSPCALAFRDKRRLVDLSGLARVRWNTKTSGFHQIRPIVKLADGTWLVGNRPDGTTRDWILSEISFADLHWLTLDITRVVTTGTVLDKVDLSKVDEIGFADLMPGSGHGPGGWSDVAQVQVYGKPGTR